MSKIDRWITKIENSINPKRVIFMVIVKQGEDVEAKKKEVIESKGYTLGEVNQMGPKAIIYTIKRGYKAA